QNDVMDFKLNKNGKITGVSFAESDSCNYGLDVILVKRELLIDLVNDAYNLGMVSFSHAIIDANYKKLDIYGYCHEGFAAVMDGVRGYFEANMALLNKEVRDDLLNRERPIFTNGKDDMPAKYGIEAVVENAIIADGCIIEGEVRNSVLFRDVIVAAGAVVENSILMEGTTIGSGCELNYMITDRFATITEDKKLDGRVMGQIIGKNETV
ncbi:MAG: glucose-1-phosphate adenylyltransferase subunit GlgD, partial [Clostridia bacterium]|nr:glucose-1-phosphate adenylyltransferase subunit GlgD [Clostridia bacterium]